MRFLTWHNALIETPPKSEEAKLAISQGSVECCVYTVPDFRLEALPLQAKSNKLVWTFGEDARRLPKAPNPKPDTEP